MTRLTLALALALAPAANSCGGGELTRCVSHNYSMTGDGQNGVIRDSGNAIVASQTVTADHEISDCPAKSTVPVVLKHESTGKILTPPDASNCVQNPSAPGQEVKFEIPTGKGCRMSWTPDPTSPGIPFPIRVRP